jgi:tRNA nucleotidyltransferase (CCA-adding enzyme)
MQEELPKELIDFLTVVGELSDARGQRICLVGGAVRDLLLKRRNLDFDLVVEGDVLGLARQLARAGKGVDRVDKEGEERVTVHRRFGTAKFRRGGLTIDLAMARSETYDSPGALPTVKPGTIEDDLRRRDFSINAMAVFLMPASFGQLLDPHGGREDLDRGLVRILHDGSFVDDATRMLRAVRYEQRLGFKLEQDTERLLRANISSLDTISGDRIRRELELILSEDCPERSLERAQGLGILQQLAPYIEIDNRISEGFQKARQQKQTYPAVYMMLLIYPLGENDIERFIGRLSIVGQLAKAMRQIPRLKDELPCLDDQCPTPSAVYRLLKRYYVEAIVAAWLYSGSQTISARVESYLNKYRYVNPALDGTDLQRLGIQPGPRMGRMLETLREAKIDGQLSTREEEEALVRRLLGES